MLSCVLEEFGKHTLWIQKGLHVGSVLGEFQNAFKLKSYNALLLIVTWHTQANTQFVSLFFPCGSFYGFYFTLCLFGLSSLRHCIQFILVFLRNSQLQDYICSSLMNRIIWLCKTYGSSNYSTICLLWCIFLIKVLKTICFQQFSHV